jgi:hypothetical protein
MNEDSTPQSTDVESPSILDEASLNYQSMSALQSEARFVVSGGKEVFDVKIEMPKTFVKRVADAYLDGQMPEPQTALTIDFVRHVISIFPQITYASERLYKPKYGQLYVIEISISQDIEFIEGHGDVVDLLEKLPSAFIKDPAYGLGFVMEMRPLEKALRKIKGVTRLVISDDGSRPTTWCRFRG